MYLLKYSLRLHFICSKIELDHYRPQRSCGQANIFTPVCHSVHRGGFCLSACWNTTPHPPDQADTSHPPRTRQTPPRQGRPPPGPGRPPQTRHPPPPDQAPPPEADSSIRSTSGRYASYWNAFLFLFFFKLKYFSQIF